MWCLVFFKHIFDLNIRFKQVYLCSSFSNNKSYENFKHANEKPFYVFLNKAAKSSVSFSFRLSKINALTSLISNLNRLASQVHKLRNKQCGL